MMHLGNILMLSEGKPGIDRVYSLREGMAEWPLRYTIADIDRDPDVVFGQRKL